MKMQKIGKVKILKGKCSNCGNKFITTSDDFFMTKNIRWGTLSPMIRCPYCRICLYKSFKFFGRTIWEEPYWDFKIVKEDK